MAKSGYYERGLKLGLASLGGAKMTDTGFCSCFHESIDGSCTFTFLSLKGAAMADAVWISRECSDGWYDRDFHVGMLSSLKAAIADADFLACINK